jgi:UDP-N-acetyl-D-mannosaminuronic acid transferase (WecB/TagA/CpsF family)
LVLLETDDGVTLISRDELERQVQAEFAGADLVTELLAERRAEAEREAAE